MKIEEIKLTHPYNMDGCTQRLCREYDEHKKLVIGFDFDNTIFDCHNDGGNYSAIITILQECKELGFILCLFTAEPSEEHLKWKIDFCKHYDIEPDYVNDSPLKPTGTKKPMFNLLLDDRAGLESAYITLRSVITHARFKLNSQTKK